MIEQTGHGRTTHPWVAEGQRRVRFGVFGGPARDWAAMLEWVRAVEELGFDSYWAGDHPVEFPFDGWTHLAAMATATRRIRLGSLVTFPLYRHPLVLARQVADVDRLSGGRVVLGLGIGDAPREFAQLGLNYGPPRERQEMLDEALQVLPPLLAGQTVSHAGRHVRLDEARLSPPALQLPHVPILIAGGGERVTLQRVARHADASNFGAGNLVGGAWGPDDVRRKYEVLRAHCHALGRPYNSVLRTHISFGLQLREDATSERRRVVDRTFAFEYERMVGTPEAAAASFRALAAAGVQYFIVNMGDDLQTLRLLAERVVPALAT
jgi:alkanesulfonate monooxygenase SsuD/methylene tetrahydromethanopterin reductase-like flavin-dependent oxidoreductase (luciferase family)